MEKISGNIVRGRGEVIQFVTCLQSKETGYSTLTARRAQTFRDLCRLASDQQVYPWGRAGVAFGRAKVVRFAAIDHSRPSCFHNAPHVRAVPGQKVEVRATSLIDSASSRLYSTGQPGLFPLGGVFPGRDRISSRCSLAVERTSPPASSDLPGRRATAAVTSPTTSTAHSETGPPGL